MSDRALTRFLKAGLLPLEGNDAWFEKISAAADTLAAHLRASPPSIVPFLYSALDVDAPDDDPAIAATIGYLESEWQTYPSVFQSTPTLLVRAIILDALISNSKLDSNTENALAVLIASAIPNVDFGGEADVWTETLKEIREQVERRAERDWSVPSNIDLPAFEMGNLGTIEVPIKYGVANQDALESGFVAAVGPNDESGAETGGNPNWPNAPEQWAPEFARIAASTVKVAVDEAVKLEVGPVKVEEAFGCIAQNIDRQLVTVLSRVSSASQGLELRSRLLWWKEARYSPSARVSYRLMDCLVAPGIMAFDYQSPLPALTPSSVVAFLRETVGTLTPENNEETHTLGEHVAALGTSSYAKQLRKHISNMVFAEGRQPVVSCIAETADCKAAIDSLTVYSSDAAMTRSDFATLLFLEFQANKAISDIEPEGSPNEAAQ